VTVAEKPKRETKPPRQPEDRNSGGPIMRAEEIRRHYEENRSRR